ncbi:MAG: aspartate kinase, partial [Bdellovibrionales bacterium]|nr:aspartate kinase [Bdellovibrionales bacterium]
GGTSVQDAPAIRRLVEIVETRKGLNRLVVVSALAKVTDSLVALCKDCEAGNRPQALARVEELKERHLAVARELGLKTETIDQVSELFLDLEGLVSALGALKEVSPRSKDRLLATGELGSSLLVSGALESIGRSSIVDSRDFIVTDSQYGGAQVNFSATNARISLVTWDGAEEIKVAQGFIGKDQNGVTTTLGRGGSDYSAAVYGTCLSAVKIEIWTDVDGILTTDPRLVPEATILPKMHFSEAAELAYFGAKVLHPATIYPALEKRIPVWILNSKNPTARGTEITFSEERAPAGISGIAFKRNVTLVNIYSTRMLGAHGFLKSVFDIFARHQLSVDLISTSEVNV